MFADFIAFFQLKLSLLNGYQISKCMIQYFNTHPNKELYQNADCLCNYLYIYETGQDNSYCIVNPNKIKERNINGSVLHLKNNFIKATYFGGYELEYFNTHQLRRPE